MKYRTETELKEQLLEILKVDYFGKEINKDDIKIDTIGFRLPGEFLINFGNEISWLDLIKLSEKMNIQIKCVSSHNYSTFGVCFCLKCVDLGTK